MKNSDKWKPTKFVYSKNKLICSRDQKEVSICSRLISDIIANYYESYIPKYSTGMLIDIGCGKVPLYGLYKEYIIDNICVDWPNSLHKNTFLDYECDINNGLPFNDEVFDTIILSDVLEHIANPEILWYEMNRILKYDGIMLMNVPFFYWLHEQPYDYYRYTEHALRRFANVGGFQILHLEAIGGSPEIMGDFLSKHLMILPFIGKSSAISIQYLTQLFLQTKVGKKISKETSKCFPLGYFMVAQKTRESKME